MSYRQDSMINPPNEELLGRVDSKFSLVTLAARRARQMNSYFNQLGEGLGSLVPPQVASTARKPLSISFEELAAAKLVATLLATRAPVIVCPAMHTEMWEQPAVQANVALLRERGVTVVDPVAGMLAGGDVGVGRMAEPVDIVAACAHALTGDLDGLRVLVTAGGTREPIDPVRFIGNRSSGKQGHAVANEAAARGARVVVVTTANRPAGPAVEVVRVETAAGREAAVLARRGAEACGM